MRERTFQPLLKKTALSPNNMAGIAKYSGALEDEEVFDFLYFAAAPACAGLI